MKEVTQIQSDRLLALADRIMAITATGREMVASDAQALQDLGYSSKDISAALAFLIACGLDE